MKMRYVTFGALILAADQLTKWWATTFLVGRVELLSFLAGDVVLNRGLSWSLLCETMATSYYMQLLVSVLIGLLIVYFIWMAVQRSKEGALIYAEVAIIAGACSNLADRIRFGGVVDFILIHWRGWQWPHFNLADIAIVAGVTVILARQIFDRQDDIHPC